MHDKWVTGATVSSYPAVFYSVQCKYSIKNTQTFLSVSVIFCHNQHHNNVLLHKLQFFNVKDMTFFSLRICPAGFESRFFLGVLSSSPDLNILASKLFQIG